jgi:1-acyl-sn-glycerol-3-phosphate acyltransferase
MLYGIGSLYSRLCYHWRANRPCPFSDASPAIVIGNHRCPLDPLFIWLGNISRRPIGFMMAREYYETPGLRFISSSVECIPVLRDGKDTSATRAALRRLQAGKLLGVFPEGRINLGAGLLPANPGVGWLALRSRAPVYPVFLHNTPPTHNMIEPFFTFTRVRVTYGDPIDLSAFYDRPMSESLVREATDYMMAALARLGAESAPEAEPAAPPAILPMTSAG